VQLEKALQVSYRHAGVGEDAAKRSLCDIATRMDGDRGAAPVRVAHDVVASRDPGNLEPGPF
jgi:hypothetical protein